MQDLKEEDDKDCVVDGVDTDEVAPEHARINTPVLSLASTLGSITSMAAKRLVEVAILARLF
jgi:hypothetical protein